MADTIREQIIASIASTLASYSGYMTLSGVSVVRGMEFIDYGVNPPPIISVLAQNETVEAEDGPYGKETHVMPVQLWALMSFSPSTPSQQGEAAFGEIVKATMSSLPSSALSMFFSGGGVQYPGSLEETLLSINAEFTVTYQTDVGDPYTNT